MQLQPAVQEIYGSIRRDGTFEGSLRVVAELLQSHISAIHWEDFDLDQHHVSVVGNATDHDLSTLERDYQKRWGPSHNPWIKAGLPTLLGRGFDFGDDHVTRQELVSSDYYQHYLKNVEVRYGLGICLWKDLPGKLAVASFNRRTSQGAFGKRERAIVAALHPHLVNAYALHLQMNELRLVSDRRKAMTDEVALAVFALDPDGCVLDRNLGAELLLSETRDVWQDDRRRLHFRNIPQSEFARLLGDLARTSTLGSQRTIVARPPDPSGRRLLVHLHAVPARAWSRAPLMMVQVSLPTRKMEATRARKLLGHALGLTTAEAALLAALRHIHDLEVVAEDLGISVATARCHLQHIFGKTNTRKQSELLALVERILISAPPTLH